ncbi:MAG: type II toxin-antitoxin system VapB family antitoxin [Thermoleophilia bacterium]
MRRWWRRQWSSGAIPPSREHGIDVGFGERLLVTKKAAVTEALKEYIQRRRQIEITSLFGKVDYDRDYDYKKTRSRG